MFRFRVDNPADEMEVDDTDPTDELEQEQEPKRKTPEKPRLRISTTLKDKLKAAALAKGITMEHFIESRCGLPTAPQENHNTVSFSASVCLAQLSQLQQLAAFTRCPLHGDASTAQFTPSGQTFKFVLKCPKGCHHELLGSESQEIPLAADTGKRLRMSSTKVSNQLLLGALLAGLSHTEYSNICHGLCLPPLGETYFKNFRSWSLKEAGNIWETQEPLYQQLCQDLDDRSFFFSCLLFLQNLNSFGNL